MRITILSIGSRGDVQPLIALGLGLKSAGYDITIATHGVFESLVRKLGLEFSLIQANPREALESEEGQKTLQYGDNPLRSMWHYGKLIKSLLIQAGNDAFNACKAADSILFSHLGSLLAPHIAEKLRLPTIAAYIVPVHSTREISIFSSPKLRGVSGAITKVVLEALRIPVWFFYRSVINKWRTEYLELGPLTFAKFTKLPLRPRLILYGISPTVFPKPSDWGDDIKVTGYWFLDEEDDWSPPPELLKFISNGTPPVYIGFGSMITRDPKRLTELVLKALDRSKQRGILLSGWGCLGETKMPDYALEINSAPHGWLFPKMAAVVHHGGPGTIAAGLRAGRPTIVIPFFLDQPFWGLRVAQLGAGPEPIPFKQLSVDRLAKSINETVNNNKIKERAIDLGRRISSEQGVKSAVEEIEKFLSAQ